MRPTFINTAYNADPTLDTYCAPASPVGFPTNHQVSKALHRQVSNLLKAVAAAIQADAEVKDEEI